MADEFQIRSGNWWEPSRNSGTSSSSSTVVSSIGSYGWSSIHDSVSVSSNTTSSNVFGDTQKMQRSDYSGGGCVMAADPNLQFMGLGLSSQSMDWNQPPLHRSAKAESGFHSLLQEDHLSSNNNYQQESGISPSSSLGLNSNYHINSDVYGSSSAMLQGLFGSDHDHTQQSSFENRSINFPYQSNYGMNSGEELSQFPPKQTGHGQIQFTNNAPFWNASMAAMNNLQSSFFPSSQSQYATPTFNEKPKNQSEVGDLGTVGKKSNNEPSTKRARSETPSTMPAFKVRKEKMGDRITALQQLVSPFGKTDTASVLSETIEYIKLLHEQVSVFSGPYMKSGASIQHQQSSNKTKDSEGPKQDLKSRGLCLVPVSSTFPVTHETTVDFWTPTFGGAFR